MHKVGDRVRVNAPGYVQHGEETVVLRLFISDVSGKSCCQVDLPSAFSPEGRAGFFDHNLIPIYNGNEKTEWEDCVWQPEVVLVGQDSK